MKLASPQDESIAVKIIADTFEANLSVSSVIGLGRNRKKKISRLASYAFIKAINRGGAYISDNKMGAALCFRSNNNSSNLKEFIAEIRFTLSIPIAKVIHALKREAYLKKHRYQGDHFYF
ncbi:MAG: hypothetical protein HRT72_11140 [Flavobacteriales bacterium]|nr:hypothetical protein [Flavobacteriales bacterium]